MVGGAIGQEATFDGAQGLEAGRLTVEFVAFLPARTAGLDLPVIHTGFEQHGIQLFEFGQRSSSDVFFIGVAAQAVERDGGDVEPAQDGQKLLVRVDGGWGVFVFHGFGGG